jgi:hypothetical protein
MLISPGAGAARTSEYAVARAGARGATPLG